MFRVVLTSTGLLLGCAQVSAPEVAQDVVVNTDSVEFVVFQQNEKVMAVYRGRSAQPAENRLKPAAARAMEQASGCPIQANSLEVFGLQVYGQVDCARTNSLFLRARMAGRGRSPRGGGDLRPPRMPEIEQKIVAAE